MVSLPCQFIREARGDEGRERDPGMQDGKREAGTRGGRAHSGQAVAGDRTVGMEDGGGPEVLTGQETGKASERGTSEIARAFRRTFGAVGLMARRGRGENGAESVLPHLLIGAGEDMAEQQGRNLAGLRRWYTPAKALRQATSMNATVLDLSGPRKPYAGALGLVRAGACADLLLVDGDPTEDLSLVANVTALTTSVCKGGSARIHTEERTQQRSSVSYPELHGAHFCILGCRR